MYACAAQVLLKAKEPSRTLAERVQRAADQLVSTVVHSGHSSDNVTAVIAMLGDDPAVVGGSSGGVWSADS